MKNNCSCFGTGLIHAKFASFGDYVIVACPDCSKATSKTGRLTSTTVVRSETYPRNRAYLERRRKKNYIKNSGDLKFTVSEITFSYEYFALALSLRPYLHAPEITRGSFTQER